MLIQCVDEHVSEETDAGPHVTNSLARKLMQSIIGTESIVSIR